MPDLLPALDALFPLPPLRVFGRDVHAFGLLVTLGIGFGSVISLRRARPLGLSSEVMGLFPLVVVISGFIGSHLVYVFAYHPDSLVGRPLFLFEIWSGMSSLGGFIGAAIGAFWFLRLYRKVPFLPYVDGCIFGFPLGWAFGRLGCTVSFDHPGVITDFVMGMEFSGDGSIGAGIRHNLGFYEFIWSVVMAAYFYSQRTKPHFKGWYAATFVISFVLFRFPLDFLRVGDMRYVGLTPAQWLSLVMLALCAHLAVFGSRRRDLLVPDGVPKPEMYPSGVVEEAGMGT